MYAQRHLFRYLPAALVGLLFLAAPPPARADTDFLRELAKNRTRLLIVRSGPEALPFARRLQQTIMANGDFRGRGEEYCRIANSWAGAADLLKEPTYARASVVFLLTGNDLQGAIEPLPADLTRLLPCDPKLLGGRVAVTQAALGSDRPGSAAYRIALYAPDAPRLGRLYERFTARRADNFRELPFAERYTTNRLALFSAPEDREIVEGWGRLARRDVWNETRWYPLSERDNLTAEQLAESTEAYFLDRSRQGQPLPEPAARALAGQRIGTTTVAVVHRGGEPGGSATPVVVFSAPSRLLLQTRVARLPNVPALPADDSLTDVLDLSRVGSTTLLIVGGSDVPPDVTGRLHAEIARSLRGKLGIPVEPRGTVVRALEGDLALQMVQGATDTRGFLRRKYPTRYAWLFTITDIRGGTTYRTAERKLTPDLGPFTESEPYEPRQKKDESDRDYNRRYREWRKEFREWERRRRDWEDHYRLDPCTWELTLTREHVAEVRGLLQIIDVKTANGAAFLWEKECRDQASDSAVVRNQQTTVQGHDNRPSPLEVPSNSDQYPPGLLLTAAVQAADRAVETLREEALLPDPSAAPPVIVGAVGAKPDAPDANAAVTAKVAEVDGQTITLNVGANRGVRVGDRYEVILTTKETVDPDTGRVLRVRPAEVVAVVVTHVDAEAADARAATQDAAKMSRVKIGMAVRRAARAR